jgi:alpha-L-rhamnosidase
MSYLFDTSGFLGEWLVDLALDQKRLEGVVPIFCPDTGTDKSFPEAIWGDVAVLTPFDLYVAHGDVQLLERQYESVTMWLSKGVRREKNGLWARDQDQLADWLAPKSPPQTPNMCETDNFFVADAWLIHSTKTAAKICRAIGKLDEAEKYDVQVTFLIDAFYAEYITKSGRLVGETQTALCLLLHYDIFPSSPAIDYRTIFSTRLAHLVARANWLVDTGFAGTPIILETLAETHSLSHAYRMLQSKTCPSWLACVLLGATSIWERWDSMLSDGTINPGEMTSFNHYALGSVASFMHRVIGGLSPVENGWKKVLVRPQPGGTVTSARTSHRGPYGKIEVDWRIEDGMMLVKVDIPPNTTAHVILPGEGGLEETIGSGKREYKVKYALPSFPPPIYEPHFAPIRPNEWI